MGPEEKDIKRSLCAIAATADSSRVRRTQRVVRNRALDMRAGKKRLFVVMFSGAMVSLLLGLATVPLWNELDAFAHSSGIPDLQIHMLFLAVWFLPGTIAALWLWRGMRKRVEHVTRLGRLAQR